MSNDYDDDALNKLPNFIPPEAQKSHEAEAPTTDAQWAKEAVDNLIREVNSDADNLVNITITDTETTTVSIDDPSDKGGLKGVQRDFPEIPPEAVDPVDEVEEKIEEALEQKHIDLNDPLVQAAILEMATQINTQNQHGVEESEELKHLRELLQQRQLNQPQGTATSVNLLEGVASVVAGGASVIGGAASVVGSGLKAASQAIDNYSMKKANQPTAVPDGVRVEPTLGNDVINSDDVMILPRISEYRVTTTEKAANAYEEAKNQFWQAGTMPDVKREIEERARVTGISVPDVMEKMKPGGEMEDLHKKFTEAVAASPDAQSHKKSMDKALESWGRQYGRGQEELLNPETEGLPQYENMRTRLNKSKEQMEEQTQGVPAFDQEKSHAERLKEMMERLVEKLKEFAQSIINAFKGKKAEHGAVAHAEP